MLASVRPRDIAGKTRRRIAAEELAELVAVEAKMKKANAELKAMVLARGSHLMDLRGVGPVVAARVLADVGDVSRFADRNRFASWTGTAPLDASSGEHESPPPLQGREPADANHMIHIAAISQIRLDTDGQAYYRRKRAEGKRPLEAIRCLKRRISDAIYPPARHRRHSRPDAKVADDENAGPGGHRGASQDIQRGRLEPAHRHFGSATSRTRLNDATPRSHHAEDPPRRGRLTTEGSRCDACRRAADPEGLRR